MLPLLALLLAYSAAASPADDDKISSLPGLGWELNFDQYSGYLRADEDHFYHYWFVESQSSPSRDPVLLWLNGGPGCSSLDGLLNEMGPFRPDHEGKNLTENPHSWNTFANILYLESPVCVGFSYNAKESLKKCKASDETTAQRNLVALKEFFKRFPKMASNDFYVTGEGYAGIYVPTLVLRILLDETKPSINLKGYAVGNGLPAGRVNKDSIFFYAYGHGILDEEFWEELVGACCEKGIASRDYCYMAESQNLPCLQKQMDAMWIILKNSGLNRFNLYDDCHHPNHTAPVSRLQLNRNSFYQTLMELGWNGDPPCTDYSAMYNYLNRADVKAALHVKNETKWEICNNEVGVTYQTDYKTLELVYEYIFTQGIRGLSYNGDVDLENNYLGNQWFFEALPRLPVTEATRTWHVNDQTAGFVKRFRNLDLLTVKGAGHMVPKDKPEQALHLIKAFIKQEDY